MFEQQFDQNDESQGTDDGVSADCVYPVSLHFLGRQWLADGRHLEEHQTEVSQSQKQQRCKDVVRRSELGTDAWLPGPSGVVGKKCYA